MLRNATFSGFLQKFGELVFLCKLPLYNDLRLFLSWPSWEASVGLTLCCYGSCADISHVADSPKKSLFRPLFGVFYPHPAHKSALRAEAGTHCFAPGKPGWPPTSTWPLFSRPTPHAPRRQDQRGQVVRRPFPAGYCLTPSADLSKSERGPISTIGLSLSVCHRTGRPLRTNRTFSPRSPPPDRWPFSRGRWRWTSSRKGPPTSWNQGNVAPFAFQDERRPKLRGVFLLPTRSLVKCIPDRPMHAGVIVMALCRVASRDIKNLQGPEPSVRPLYPA